MSDKEIPFKSPPGEDLKEEDGSSMKEHYITMAPHLRAKAVRKFFAIIAEQVEYELKDEDDGEWP